MSNVSVSYIESIKDESRILLLQSDRLHVITS